MIDESKAIGLQEMYMAGALGALQPLHEECTAIAYRVVKTEYKHLYLSREKVEEIAHDAAARLIERYYKDPAFHVRRFAKSLSYSVKKEVLADPRSKQKFFEARVRFVNGAITKIPDGREKTVSCDDLALELAESHEWGKKAVADLCRSRSYRQAIRRIAVYVGRQWIYDHSAALHGVYKTLHRPQGKGGRLSPTGLRAVRKVLLQDKQDKREPADKHAGGMAEG